MSKDRINESFKREDLDRMRELPCCKQGMKFHEAFCNVISFCEEHKEEIEKWHQKRKKNQRLS